MRGRRTHFVLLRDETPILYSKIHAKSTTEIIHFARRRTDFHFGNHNFEAALLVYSNFKTFLLRCESQFGADLMKLSFSRLAASGSHRFAELIVFDGAGGPSRQFLSEEPVMGANGRWASGMIARNGKPSVKNMVLLGENRNVFLSVAKIDSSVLRIEADPGLSDLCVFAFGISSFLCSL
jgi:hypothetical protein